MTLLRNVMGRTKAGLSKDIFVDDSGRMKISQGQPSATHGSLSAVAQTVVLSMDGFSSFTVYLRGTFTGVGLTLEQSPDSTDGVDGNWWPAIAVSNSVVGLAALSGLVVAGSTQTSTWTGFAPGASFVRVRMTTRTTGTAEIDLVSSTSAVTPVNQSHGVTVSNTVNTQPSVTLSTPVLLTSAASTNSTLVVAAATNLTEIAAFNPTAAVVYLKLYNKATAPTVGTDIPILTIPVSVNGLVNLEFGPMGKRFLLGLGLALTAGPLATDTVAIAAGVQVSGSRV